MLLRTVPSSEINLTTSETLQVWHERVRVRLGHINKRALHEMMNKNLVQGIKLSDTSSNFFCESCVKGKQHRLPFSQSNDNQRPEPGEKIYSDLCGPMSTALLRGSKFLVVFKDACTGYRSV